MDVNAKFKMELEERNKLLLLEFKKIHRQHRLTLIFTVIIVLIGMAWVSIEVFTKKKPEVETYISLSIGGIAAIFSYFSGKKIKQDYDDIFQSLSKFKDLTNVSNERIEILTKDLINKING